MRLTFLRKRAGLFVRIPFLLKKYLSLQTLSKWQGSLWHYDGLFLLHHEGQIGDRFKKKFGEFNGQPTRDWIEGSQYFLNLYPKKWKRDK